MQSSTQTFVLFAVILIWISSCGEAPKEQSQTAAVPQRQLDAPESEITLPISYGLDELEALVNRKISGQLYRDNSFDNHNNDGLKIQVRKTRDIRIEMSGNFIWLAIPLEIKCKFDREIAKMHVRNKKWINTQLTMYLSSPIALTEDWKLRTKTQFDRIGWEEDPKLKIAFVNVNLKKPIEMALARYQEELEQKVDQLIYEKADITKPIGKIWDKIHSPLLIKKDPPHVWLLIESGRLAVGQLNGQGRQIIIPLRLNTRLQTAVGTESPNWKPSPLPPALPLSDPSPRFDLFLRVSLPYTQINSALENNLKTQRLQMQGYELRIEQVTAQATSGGLFQIKAAVSGALSGDIYFHGLPMINNEQMTLSLQDFDYDVQAMGTLLSSADWFMHDHFKAKIEEKLHVELQPFVDKIPELADRGIERSKAGDKLDLSLDSVKLSLHEFQVNKDDLQLVVRAQGQAGIQLQELD